MFALNVGIFRKIEGCERANFIAGLSHIWVNINIPN